MTRRGDFCEAGRLFQAFSELFGTGDGHHPSSVPILLMHTQLNRGYPSEIERDAFDLFSRVTFLGISGPGLVHTREQRIRPRRIAGSDDRTSENANGVRGLRFLPVIISQITKPQAPFGSSVLFIP